MSHASDGRKCHKYGRKRERAREEEEEEEEEEAEAEEEVEVKEEEEGDQTNRLSEKEQANIWDYMEILLFIFCVFQ